MECWPHQARSARKALAWRSGCLEGGITWGEACFCALPGGRTWTKGAIYRKLIDDSGLLNERAAFERDSLEGLIEAHHHLQGPGEGGWP